MLLNLSLVFALCYFIEISETHNLPSISDTKYAAAKNREELIDIIRSLNDHQKVNNNIEEQDTELNNEEKEKKLQNILWLIKKNYNAQKEFEYLHNNQFHSASRLHVIKNPLVLEEYKKHLKKFGWFSNTNSKKTIDHQQNNLKNKLRNMRRDAMFRLGSSESYSNDIDETGESKLKVKNGILSPSNNPITKIRKEKVQVSKQDKFVEYPEIKDTLELHNTNGHNTLRSDYDFRREKSKWDEIHENSNTVEEDIKKKKIHPEESREQSSHKKKRFEDESLNWDKITTTTHNYPIKYKKKITLKESEFKIRPSYNKPKITLKQSEYEIRPSYNKPKKDNMNKVFHLYGRTSIPFVGKRGIYDEK